MFKAAAFGAMQVGQEPVICTMDGDRYIVRIPSISTYSSIMALKNEDGSLTNPFFGAKNNLPCLVRKKDAKNVYLSSISGTEPVDVYTLSEALPKSMLAPVNQNRYPIRLMLEPLDSNGYITHDLECNPNGSVVEGGCLYRPSRQSSVDEDGLTGLNYENVTKLLADGELNFIDIALEDGLIIGDTSEDVEPLQWVCCSGRLVSKEVLCSSALPYLWQNGYVIYASRSTY